MTETLVHSSSPPPPLATADFIPARVRKWAKLALLFSLLVGFALAQHLDIQQHFSFDALRAHRNAVGSAYAQNPGPVLTSFVVVYALAATPLFPGAAFLTVAAGAIFGLLKGTAIVAFSSALGSAMGFFLARFLLRELVEKRFADSLSSFNEGLAKHGAAYIFSVRLVPLFPFFVVNLMMGLTRVPSSKFFLISQIGMIPGTIVFVNAGTQLAAISTLQDVASPSVIGSLLLLAMFPWLAKRAFGRAVVTAE